MAELEENQALATMFLLKNYDYIKLVFFFTIYSPGHFISISYSNSAILILVLIYGLTFVSMQQQPVIGFEIYICVCVCVSQVVLVVKNPPANTEDIRDVDSIPGSGRSPAGGHGNPFQYSCLGNLMDRGAWWAMVHMVAKNQI